MKINIILRFFFLAPVFLEGKKVNAKKNDVIPKLIKGAQGGLSA